MDLEEETNTSNDTNSDPELSSLTNINPDAPDFVKDIVNKKNVPLDIDYQFKPNNPYTLNGNDIDYNSNSNIEGIHEKSGFFETAAAEAKNFNFTYQAGHAAYEKYEQVNPLDDPAPAGWTPKSDISKFINIRPQNMSYLMESTGPKDLDYRLQRVMTEQSDEDILANGSFTAKLVGGVAGMATDPLTYVPIAGWAKYGKLGAGFLKNAARAAPGALAYGALSAAAEQANKVNGNLKDFAVDTFTRTVFASALFGVGGALSAGVEHMKLWEARNISKNYFDGIDYKLAMDKEGKITGITAHDTEGSLSAAQVSIAQDLANSTFAKSGLFKIPGLVLNAPGIKPIAEKISKLPYAKATGELVGSAAHNFYKYFGSELPLALTSPFKSVRSFFDRSADHGIQTTGLQNGETAPKRFGALMQQTFAGLRALDSQMRAMHLERNGVDIQNRFAVSAVDMSLNLYNKGLKALSKDIGDKEYVSREQFDSEVEETLLTKNSNNHAPVNDAANLIRKQLDETYKSYRKAYNLPEDWFPTKTAEGYLMRVYNTPYMNVNLDSWNSVISNWLKESDDLINEHMEPINTLSETIKDFEARHTDAVHVLANIDAKRIENQETTFSKLDHGTTTHIPGESEKSLVPYTTELQPGSPAYTLNQMRTRLRSMKDSLQNNLRSNPNLQLHVDDWNALSADEAAKIKEHTKTLNQLQREVDKQKQVVKLSKKEASKKLSIAKNEPKIPKAIPKSKTYVEIKSQVQVEEEKLRELQEKHFIEDDKLQQKMHNGEIDRRLFTQKPDSFQYQFKDPNDRLKFREVYPEGSAKEPNIHRKKAAKAYYDTIMNQTPEETINQIMGKFTGNKSENPIKQRTLLVHG